MTTNMDPSLPTENNVDSDIDRSQTLEKPEGNIKSPLWNVNSCFPPIDDEDFAQSPTSIAAGSKSLAELLRRLSLASTDRNSTPATNLSIAHPSLCLSGNLISASICIPHTLIFRNGDWTLEARRGTSALFDSLSYLSSSKSQWNHTLIGWTGEIKVESNYNTVSPGLPHLSYRSSSILRQSASPSRKKQSIPFPLSEAPKRNLPSTPSGCLYLSRKDRQNLEAQLLQDQGGRIVPVWLFDPSEEGSDEVLLADQARWRRYAEHQLYTLFHYRHPEHINAREARKHWTDYCLMNEKFADKIIEIYKPGDIVWIHDYHLMLLPSLLRQRVPNMYIGFFMHVPFPSSEYMKCLSQRKEVLTGMLGANMIGFQTYDYSRHFSSCCTRILGFESTPAGVDAYGAHVPLEIFPIGIDAVAVARTAYEDKSVQAKIASIRHQFSDKKIIVGRDRMDSVRGVAQKVQAYELFLERYPEWRGKVILIQVTSPTSIEEEKEDSHHKIANRISNLVTRVNGLYGGLEYAPVCHYPQYLSREEYFALLRVADIGLITSVRDGMNTTSLEYVLCQKEGHGPLIISEFSGTAANLDGAIRINPWDLAGVASAIDAALKMAPDSKKKMHNFLYKQVKTNDVQEWTRTYLGRLVTNLASFNESIVTPLLDQKAVLTRYESSKKRLFMFDYDGTLTPIVRDPQAAIPSDRTIRNIKGLAEDKNNSVWIISGRDQAFLDEHMGHITDLGLSAEHGSFVRQPGSEEWENLTTKLNMAWQDETLNLFQQYTERTQGSFIERKRIALTWHYRRADPDYGAFQAEECKKDLERTVATTYEVEVMRGKANIEVRPKFVNKGEIAKRLLRECGDGLEAMPDFVFCSGDDFTDEDMFRALRASSLPKENIFSVTVGASSKKTLATWHLLEPADVIQTISALNSATGAGGKTAVSTNAQAKIAKFLDEPRI